MKRLLLINSVCGIRSTGRICADIANEYESNGWEVKIAYGRELYVPSHCRKWAVRIGGSFEMKIHALITRLFDRHATGICSYFGTRRFLKWAEKWRPDIVWLHNIHGYYLNAELLFEWIKRHPDMEIKWTQHSCWSFTGHCSHFTYVKCDKWKDGCYDCPAKNSYPKSILLSAAKSNWQKKKKAFTGVKNMKLITPSRWLADLVKQSFLKDYPVEVVNNTIDTNVFRPRAQIEIDALRQKYGLVGKKTILGVASTWDRRKGIDDFIALSGMVGNDWVIVLVGLSDKQLRNLPENVIGIKRTNSTDELACFYCAADVFFNPTKEENYPTVNLEARACGCRIATYDTGGCRETVEGYEKAHVLKEKTAEEFKRYLFGIDKTLRGE